MALPLFAFACAVLAISGQGKTVDPQYAVSPSSISAEIEPADSKLMAKSASLLAKGANGHAALIRESRSQDPKRAQAARLIMLGAGEISFVPILLEKLQLTPSLESGVADKTIERFPRQSWPILQQMARLGNPAAFYGIFRYKTLGQPELLALSKHPVAKVRANAINLLYDIPRLNEALDDPAEAVQRQAMSRLINYVNADPLLYMKDKRTHVRALVAEFAQPWTQKDFPAWVQLAEDSSPKVRKGAVL